MPFAAALSRDPSAESAVEQTCAAVLAELPGPADLVVAFLSADHAGKAALIARGICDRLGTSALIGCTGESIVGGAVEVEQEPALSLWAAKLPGAQLDLFQLEYARTADGGAFLGWPDALAGGVAEPWPAESALLVLADPFTFPADALLERLNAEQPGIPVLGGNASAAHAPGENRLLLGPRELRQGAVVVRLAGKVRVRPIVSQGCRPIGTHYVITKAERNIIHSLGGRPPLPILQEIYDTLNVREQQMMRSGLHLGRVTNEYQSTFGRGDFLIRNVIGVDQDSGAITVGDYVRTGQTVQFHLRDAQTADEDLRHLLEEVATLDSFTPQARTSSNNPSRGALLFTCNGRGTRLFAEPNHDAAPLQQLLGPTPTAGFFAAGELGPIANRNYVHGFTASVAIIETLANR
jgi:small ligand-binding sensory domain FIST